jgi:CheY-like chemotaxis protein
MTHGANATEKSTILVVEDEAESRDTLRELFELDPQAVDAVAGGELPLVATDLIPGNTRFDLGQAE